MNFKLTIQADPLEVRRASTWLQQIAEQYTIPANPLTRLDLCLNEALANILFHGGNSALTAPIYLDFQLCRQAAMHYATIIISDAGVKFDMLSTEEKQRPKTLAEAEPGGLGLIMLRNFTDDLYYDYQDGRNQLKLSIQWTETV
jgi:anti-sigma regulatory factor (Ser/Thr protein kinase)